ncbi:MAG: hypothetical protein H0W36_00940 [Gemmatimonadetes bacterium]|nr:hypothetical protein [Gemmatimonadota bacterium]
MAALSIALLVVSFVFMMGVVGVLILLRRGEGPRYATSRVYDANRREALRLLTGEAADRVPAEQWYVPALDEATADGLLAEPFREAVRAALAVVVPPDRRLVPDGEAGVRLAVEDIRVLPALSTADLRSLLDRLDDDGPLVIGLVLVNPEPPGGDARRVVLQIQALFPALGRAGREDLVLEFERLFERLKERAIRPG